MMIFTKHCIYVTDMLKMCMCKFDAENSLFDKMVGFLTLPPSQ